MVAPLGFPGRLIYDNSLLLKDAGLVASSAAATVSAAAKVIDLGQTGPSTYVSGAGWYKGVVVIDVTALEIASNDEIYDIVVQLSDTAAFATDTDIFDRCSLTLAAAEVQRSDSNKDSVIGRHLLYFDNWVEESLKRYMRLYTIVGGTIATGINYSAFISKC